MFDAIKKEFSSFWLLKDSPQRVAIGFGLGVFLGILPFTGVVAAIGLAWILRLNKTAAILGSVLTNTWLSFIVFGLSVNFSCLFLGLNDHEVGLKFQDLIQDFHWNKLTDVSILKILAQVSLGYLIVSILLGLFAYTVCLTVIYWKRRCG